MLTLEGCRQRRQRLWDRVDGSVDWIVIADPQHLVYLANYFQSPFIFRSTIGAAILVLGRDGSATLVCDNQLRMYAEEAFVDTVVAPTWYDGRTSAPARREKLLASALEHLKSCPGESFGVEAGAVPVGLVEGLRAERPQLQLVPVDSILFALKRAKDPDELAVLRRAMAAVDAAELAALRGVKPGMTEHDFFRLVQAASCEAAGEAVQIYGDFVSGPRCEKVGGPPSDRVIERGDLVILDMSVIVRGYRGDVCNTFVCDAKPTAEQRRLFEACQDALAAGVAQVRAGRAARDIDAAVRSSFAGKHLAENFRSHSGHGIGLGHPDPPYLVPESTDTLEAGDVIAIEPGQYITGVAGMRYERNYLVTETGSEVLTHLPHQLDQEA